MFPVRKWPGPFVQTSSQSAHISSRTRVEVVWTGWTKWTGWTLFLERCGLVALLLCYSVMAAVSASETTSTLRMSSSPQCTPCHLLWLDDFATASAEILVPYRREAGYESGVKNVESSELMCFSCHDGYVADSRARVRSGRQHPMAGVSALGRRRPHDLPLLREEQVYCGTCHTPHGPEHGAPEIQLAGNAFLRLAKRPGPMDLCVQCHEYATSTPEMGNHPVGMMNYRLPLELTPWHARSSGEQGGIGCQTCHNPHGAENPMLVILGGRDGSSSTLCATCHKNDPSSGGLGAYSHPVGVPLGSNNSKPRYPNGEVIPLGENGTISCMSCHDIHGSRIVEALLRFPQQNSALCTACHPEPAKALAGSEHDLRIWAPGAKNLLGETANQGGLCSACHLPHKGRLPYLWSRLPRGGRHPIDQLCLSCHARGGIASTQLSFTITHPTVINKSLVRVRADNSDPSLLVPVYDAGGRPGEQGEITCLTCHDAHHWQPGEVEPSPSPPSRHPPPGQGNVLNSFLSRRSDEQVCKHCHGVWGLWRYTYYHSRLVGKR